MCVQRVQGLKAFAADKCYDEVDLPYCHCEIASGWFFANETDDALHRNCEDYFFSYRSYIIQSYRLRFRFLFLTPWPFSCH